MCSVKKLLRAALAILVLAFSLSELPAKAFDKLILSVNGYKITAYDVHVKVLENSELDITEKISVHFDEAKHGIYRMIPLINTPSRPDSQSESPPRQKARVTDILVTDGEGRKMPTQMEGTSTELKLVIGDPDCTMTGDQTYVIKYRYNLESDGSSEVDELYYHLIGDQWDTNIGNVSFIVEMPKAFDAKKLDFLIGNGDVGDRVSYTIQGNTIFGVFTDVLSGNQGLTIRIELPEGYFHDMKEDKGYFWLGVLALFTGLSLLLYFKYGRNKRIVVKESAAIPELNPAEAGYILGGDYKQRGRLALLLYWTQKGYLSLTWDNNTRVRLTKLKEADPAMKPYEQLMFNALFKMKDEVMAEELKDQFIGVMKDVENGVSSEFHAEYRVYTAAGSKVSFLGYLFAFFSTGIVFFRVMGYTCYSMVDYMAICFFALLIFAMLATPLILVGCFSQKNGGTGSKKGVSSMLILLVLLLVLFAVILHDYAMDTVAYAGILATGLCGLVGALSRKRTAKGNAWVSELLGVKSYMEGKKVLEKDQKVFYALYPYAVTFGVADKWAAAFKDIMLTQPDWVKGRIENVYTTMYFSSLVNDQLAYYESNMTYYDSSNGGDGGGGGIGGGGGGSW